MSITLLGIVCIFEFGLCGWSEDVLAVIINILGIAEFECLCDLSVCDSRGFPYAQIDYIQ